MRYAAKRKLNQNTVLALGFAVLLCVILSIVFDYYYDLNDDILMKDIVAGVYTGTPEGHNIQMLFPISWIISLFYRVVRVLPWYGLFLCLCHFGCFFLITKGVLDFLERTSQKVAAMITEMVVIFALFLWELIFTQYTVTAALLAATAAFRFYLCDADCTPKEFFKSNILNILLVVLAFMVRTEMLLLLLPLICVTGLCKWAAEEKIFIKENFIKYFSVFGAIIAGLILSFGINMIAYGSDDWQQFNRFFDHRTEIYDFLKIPPYEGNEAFFESIGMSESEHTLLKNYNFGLDEEIDDVLLAQISEYAATLRKENSSFMVDIRRAFGNYRYRTFHETDYPWNLFVIVGYVLVLAAALWNRHFRFLWQLPCMGIVRTALWMYILYKGRAPERITHSLYLMELLILMALLLKETAKGEKVHSMYKVGAGVLLAAFAISYVGTSFLKVSIEYDRREVVNQEMAVFREYVGQNPDTFYFLDVYSTVAYSEKMFADVDNSLDNYDLMGGWANKSPLMQKKYAAFGMESMEQALFDGKAYVVVKTEQPAGYPRIEDWLPAYFADQGITVTLNAIDEIKAEDMGIFTVYQVSSR